MNKKISFIIYEKPIPLKRHRCTQKINGVYRHKCYDPQKEDKEYIRQLVMLTHPGFTLLRGPLSFSAKFYFKKPRTVNKGLYHHQSPDLDNLLKFYLDCFNNLLYTDDSQIFKINSAKYFTTTKTRTEITIQEEEQQELIKTQPIKTEPGKFFPATKGDSIATKNQKKVPI